MGPTGEGLVDLGEVRSDEVPVKACQVTRGDQVILDDPHGLNLFFLPVPGGHKVQLRVPAGEPLSPGLYEVHWLLNTLRMRHLVFTVPDSPLNTLSESYTR